MFRRRTGPAPPMRSHLIRGISEPVFVFEAGVGAGCVDESASGVVRLEGTPGRVGDSASLHGVSPFQSFGELEECFCCHSWDEAVATEVEGLSQSQGTPISAATNLGLRSAFGDPLLPSVDVVWPWWPDRDSSNIATTDGKGGVIRCRSEGLSRTKSHA